MAWVALTIEASVTARQTILGSEIPMNVELVDPIHALQFFESIEGHLAGTSNKLK